jgi:hypothetical protein
MFSLDSHRVRDAMDPSYCSSVGSEDEDEDDEADPAHKIWEAIKVPYAPYTHALAKTLLSIHEIAAFNDVPYVLERRLRNMEISRLLEDRTSLFRVEIHCATDGRIFCGRLAGLVVRIGTPTIASKVASGFI